MMTMEEIKGMSAENLNQILLLVKNELSERVCGSELVVYAHDCKDRAKYHLEKYKHWAKLVKSVDTTKTNGYAFIGDFLSVTSEHKLPTGSIIVEVCGHDIICYRLEVDGKTKMFESTTKSMSRFIADVSTLM